MERLKTFGLYLFVGSCIGLSAYLTANLCIKIRGEGWLSAALAFGLIWEAGKIIFGSYVMVQATGKMSLPSHLIAAIALVAIGGSVFATVGYFIETDSMRSKTAVEESDEYKSIKESMESTKLQMEALNNAILTDSKSPYPFVRERTINSQGQMDRLQRRYDTLSEHAQSVAVTTTQDAMLLALGLNSSSAVPYWVMAIMLDLFPIAGLHVIRTRKNASKPHSGGNSSDNRRAAGFRYSATEEPKISVVRSVEHQEEPSEAAQRTRADRAEQMLRSGDATPSYAGLRKALRCSQDEVQAVFAELRDRGVVRLEGNRHMVV